jgi:hypothetical protein
MAFYEQSQIFHGHYGKHSGGFFEEQQREPVLGIRVVGHRRQVEKAQLLLQPQGIELAADLDQDVVFFWPAERCVE